MHQLTVSCVCMGGGGGLHHSTLQYSDSTLTKHKGEALQGVHTLAGPAANTANLLLWNTKLRNYHSNREIETSKIMFGQSCPWPKDVGVLRYCAHRGCTVQAVPQNTAFPTEI